MKKQSQIPYSLNKTGLQKAPYAWKTKPKYNFYFGYKNKNLLQLKWNPHA